METALVKNRFIESLTERAKQNDSVALDKLFLMYVGNIYALALRLSADKLLAENLTLQTFKEAKEKIKLMRADYPFHQWLRAITVSISIGSFLSNNYEENKNTDDIVEFESIQSLDHFIINLPSKERIVFVLNKLEQYTIEEVSDLMCMSKNNTQIYLDSSINLLIKLNPAFKTPKDIDYSIIKIIPKVKTPMELRNEIALITKEVKTAKKNISGNNTLEPDNENKSQVIAKLKANSKYQYSLIKEKKSAKEKFYAINKFITKLVKIFFYFVKAILSLLIVTLLILALIYIIFYW
jgi:DNA-directed RNA polymerase specialized sigma24 family protein